MKGSKTWIKEFDKILINWIKEKDQFYYHIQIIDNSQKKHIIAYSFCVIENKLIIHTKLKKKITHWYNIDQYKIQVKQKQNQILIYK